MVSGTPPRHGQRIPGQLVPGQPIRGQHCQHCWGDCAGCLIAGADSCIHQMPKLPWRARLRAAGTRRFWRRVLFGPR
jgi:hypothetical protein